MSSELDDLTVLITGSTTGIGLHTAKALFNKGANIIVTCRDEVRGRRAIEQILGGPVDNEERNKNNTRLHLYSLDVTNYNSIVSFCDEITRDFEKIDVIINNAGIMGWPFELSVDGIEMHFATNVFGHYVIVNRLLPLLKKSNHAQIKARIIVISSGLYCQARSMPQIGKILGEKHWNFNSKQAYAFSKLSNCLYSIAMAKMLEPHNIDVYCVRPGFVNGTELGRETHWFLRMLAAPLIWMIAKSLDQGIDTIVYLTETSAEQLETGRLYYNRKVENYNDMVNTASVRQLWATLRHIEDLIWKRNQLLTNEDKEKGKVTRELLNESLICYIEEDIQKNSNTNIENDERQVEEAVN